MISEIRIRFFRLLRNVTIPLQKLTVVVGENDSGKTSLLELLDFILNPTRRWVPFQESDLGHGSDPTRDSVQALIEVRPMEGESFQPSQHSIFDPHVDLDDRDHERLLIQASYEFDYEQEIFRPSVRFVKGDGEDDGPFPQRLRGEIPFVPIYALRDAERELTTRAGMWNQLARSRALDPRHREELRRLGEEIGEQLVRQVLGDEEFRHIVEDFTQLVKDVLWFEDEAGEFVLSATPADPRSLIAQIEVYLRNPSDSKPIPILGHGAGTQSIALIALFWSYLRALGFRNAVLAIEEPEAHLHPQAQRTLVKRIRDLPNQVIITTHSVHVADAAELTEIVVLRRRGGQSLPKYLRMDMLTDRERRYLERVRRDTGSEFLFAKCVILVEGDSERLALPPWAQAMGIDLDRYGISIVQVRGGNFGPFIRILSLDAFGIKYLILCDHDQTAVGLTRQLISLGALQPLANPLDLDTNRDTLEGNNAFVLPYGNFEEFMIGEGFVQEYKNAIAQQFGPTALEQWVRRTLSNQPHLATASERQKILSFVKSKGRKPELAQIVAESITDGGSDDSRIPAFFRTVILRAVELAREEICEIVGHGDTETRT